MGHEFDDNNLPPVDVDIPDDASELDREIQAYRREVRWQRRHDRWRHLVRGMRRRGGLTPFIVGAVLVAALCAALLVVSTRPSEQALQGPGGKKGQANVGEIGGPVPDIQVTVAGKAQRLRELSPAVLVLAPRDCDCGAVLRELDAKAHDYGIPVYLVESGESAPDQSSLARRLGTHGRQPHVLKESDGVVAHAYGTRGLTTVLVDKAGDVSTVVPHATSETDWAGQLSPLRGSWQQRTG